MSLKDRLGRLTGETDKPFQIDSRQDKISELRRKIDRVMDRRERFAPAKIPEPRRTAMPLEQIIAGEETRTPYGNFFLSQSTLNADDAHGHWRICDFAHPSMDAAAFLAGRQVFKDLSIAGGLFLDTETTGLAGGTGTFPFLIGLGWFEAGSFVTCQIFARDFSEEKAMLTYLTEIASTKEFLVTFNGRAYDLNLLTARFILNRCQDILTAMPHIDLLHLSRRMFSHRLENARLSTIEAHVLGVRRDGDVPGYEIPQRYFDWLRQHDGRLLEDVFKHNKLDIVSMTSLLKYLANLVEGSEEMNHEHHGDLLKLAVLFHERGDLQKAGRMLEGLIVSHQPEVAMSARRSLSLIHKKTHCWEEAVKHWEYLLISNPYDVFAAEELAKFHEHHAREYGKALEIILKLLDKGARLSDAERAPLEHRLQRLVHRVSSQSGQ
jgi:uncharacterized protein YprB with RNaseH-like and TPR domain